MTFEVNDDQSYKWVCRGECYPGQLPYIPSFFLNNADIIPRNVLENFGAADDNSTSNVNMTSLVPPELQDATTAGTGAVTAKVAIAVDETGVVFKGEEKRLPWQTSKKFPTYGGAKVTIDCIFCQTNCAECAEGFVLLTDTAECVYGTSCPEGYAPD